MKKAILFGAGTTAVELLRQIKDQYQVLFATDNDAKKYGTMLTDDIRIVNKSEIVTAKYDYIIITTYAGFEEVKNQLISEFAIPEGKIVSVYVEPTIRAKVTFLDSFSKIAYRKNIQGNVAEAGVYRGGFAKDINHYFPDRKLYLFDTFSGHDDRDIEVERELKYNSAVKTDTLAETSVEIVMEKMEFPENCIVKKGYFPDTFDLSDDVRFAFVNIDLDLYQPIKSALEIFYPRMNKGGVILIHDYMWSYVEGSCKAVDEFAERNNIGVIPIGDGVSVAIVKN
jgi:O-methyltransferase